MIAPDVSRGRSAALISLPFTCACAPGKKRGVNAPPRAAGVLVVHRLDVLPRELLYSADEVFFTGAAAEVSPIRSIDGIQIGSGKRGPITERLQKEFFGIVDGSISDRHKWLTPNARGPSGRDRVTRLNVWDFFSPQGFVCLAPGF